MLRRGAASGRPTSRRNGRTSSRRRHFAGGLRTSRTGSSRSSVSSSWQVRPCHAVGEAFAVEESIAPIPGPRPDPPPLRFPTADSLRSTFAPGLHPRRTGRDTPCCLPDAGDGPEILKSDGPGDPGPTAFRPLVSHTYASRMPDRHRTRRPPTAPRSLLIMVATHACCRRLRSTRQRRCRPSSRSSRAALSTILVAIWALAAKTWRTWRSRSSPKPPHRSSGKSVRRSSCGSFSGFRPHVAGKGSQPSIAPQEELANDLDALPHAGILLVLTRDVVAVNRVLGGEPILPFSPPFSPERSGFRLGPLPQG